MHSLTLLLMGLLEIFPQLGEAFWKYFSFPINLGIFFVFQPATIHLKGLVIIYKTTYNLDEIHSLTLLLMGLLEIFPQVGEAFYKLLLDQFNC